MGSYPKPAKKMVKLEPELHEQIVAMAKELSISPGDLVEEAVVFYLKKTREELKARVQERLDALFAKVDSHPPMATLLPFPKGDVNA
jgi:predicted transcriptional regulator